MTTALWCLLVICFFPYVLAGIAGAQKQRQFGKVDNHEPRVQEAQLSGLGRRAVAAQQNTWEAIAIFTAAVFTAHVAGVDADSAGRAAIAFVAFRILHAVAYLRDIPTLRSVAFTGGFVCCLALFFMAARV